MIVIHIGFPKSGSSTIQTFLDANEQALRGLSIDYTGVGRRARKGHHQLVHELKSRADRFDPRGGRLADVGPHVRDSGYETTILSSELFSNCSASEIKRVADALAPASQPVRIILIIRDLIGFVPSSYAQKIRYGNNVYDFDEFFKERLSEGRFEQYEVAERWAEVFGWDALKVRVLDPALLLNGDLIDDFLFSAGLDPNIETLRSMPRQARVNESAGWMTIEAVRALFGGVSGLRRPNYLVKLVRSELSDFKKKRIGIAAEEVAPVLGWNKDKGLYLTRPQADVTLEAYCASVGRLNGQLLTKIPEPLSLDARGFQERAFLPDATHIPADQLAKFYELLEAKLDEDPRFARPAKVVRLARRRAKS